MRPSQPSRPRRPSASARRGGPLRRKCHFVRDSGFAGNREFVLEELAVFRRIGELLEALPELLSALRSSFARAAAKSIEFVGLESSFIVPFSPVTRRAVFQILQVLDFVILHELMPHRHLIGVFLAIDQDRVRARRRRVERIEYLGSRPYSSPARGGSRGTTTYTACPRGR